MRRTATAIALALSLPTMAAGQAMAQQTQAEAAPAASAPTAEEARAFVAEAEKVLGDLSEYAGRIAWLNATYINFDSDWLAARSGAELTELGVKYAKQAARYNALSLDYDTRRKLEILKQGLTLAAPDRPGAAQELSEIATRLQSTYGKGRGTLDGKEISGSDIEEQMGLVRDPAKLKEMWVSWHNNVGRPMRQDYARLVEIANEGARELGYADTGAMWRSGYDMKPEEFEKMVDGLWADVKPLYEQLHCYVRAELNKKYGDDVQPKTGPIRADLLGNMWAQEWGNIYEVVAPPNADKGYDLTELLVARDYSPVKIMQTAEGFFTSLGFAPLPETFWERSMIVKPADREVVCHASAWNVDNKEDLRVKMCTKVNGDDFVTAHHELGHNFYQRAYNQQPLLYMNGANDGFHEAIGDFIALSVTPDYLVKLGLLDKEPDAKGDVGLLMSQALDKVAFLPFGLLVDKWRWKVFSGEVTPANYNAAWTRLRQDYQGIVPPEPRSEEDFDPGAKFHVAGNTPYMRYFLARILQFQFHEAACKMAGWKGPLHRCSIYGNKQVGEKLNEMLTMGASKPWPEALKAFTGTSQMSARSMQNYFAPLMAYLKQQNKGRQCGW
ncbi:M2 family metallopeptidase [Pedomonas sp. V897]|uniref:M2 family metallopeptidase n=1 Tax=Pedomonas sp. V897 TaxID=3446482 RepID=UPI003EE05560